MPAIASKTTMILRQAHPERATPKSVSNYTKLTTYFILLPRFYLIVSSLSSSHSFHIEGLS
jgi:hypothetical protein